MKELIRELIFIAKSAGEKILEVYNKKFEIEYKDDKSPLTEADKKSHEVIVKGLSRISNYPILSEEDKNIPYEIRKHWKYFWLIDPLDGTKEFIKKNGEFTVNISLIHRNKPVLGLIYVPIKDIVYYGGKNVGAYKSRNNEVINLNSPKTVKKSLSEINIVVSKSHINKETQKFINLLYRFYKKVNTISIGSSLKFCLLAEGKADIYPRLGPTMEWDTAAAHAILNATGGKIVQITKSLNDLNDLKTFSEIKYNKQTLLNPYFIAFRKNAF